MTVNFGVTTNKFTTDVTGFLYVQSKFSRKLILLLTQTTTNNDLNPLIIIITILFNL
jgi:hypothetical protein